MVSLRFFISFIIVFFFVSFDISISKSVYLERSEIYPKKYGDYYFKPITDIEIGNNFLYAVENFGHKIVKFSISNGKIEIENKIGRHGQGPGDLNLPISLSLWNDEIAVKSSGYFSFFNVNGKFLNNFRVFTSKRNFTYSDNKIYWINSNPDGKHLIEVFTKEGKRISTIGEKFLNVDFSLFKGLGPFSIESEIYSGKLFIIDDYVIYINSKFAYLHKYHEDGSKKLEIKLDKVFGEFGKKIINWNRTQWLQKGMDITKTNNSYYSVNLFEDVYLLNDKLYFLEGNWIPGDEHMRMDLPIKVIDINSFNILEEFIIQKGKDEKISCFAVKEEEGNPSFYVFMRESEGDIIAKYTKKDYSK